MEENKDGKNERENNPRRGYSGDLNDIFGEKPEIKKEGGNSGGGINDNNRYGQNAYRQNNYNQNGYPQNGFDSRGYNPYEHRNERGPHHGNDRIRRLHISGGSSRLLQRQV
jgi:hypothetical protein